MSEPYVERLEEEVLLPAFYFEPAPIHYKKLDLSQLVTEDDTPVDNFASSKNQRLAVNAGYTSFPFPRPFLVDSNVAIYTHPGANPLVPDVFVSLGVSVADDWWAKENRSYLMWEFGKPPEVVVEIVSNRVGNEAGSKLSDYEAMGVAYYVIYDPQELLSENVLQVYELQDEGYCLRPDTMMPTLGIGVICWDGVFEDQENEWVRWCDEASNLLLTGNERANREWVRAEQAETDAERERLRAEQAEAESKAERLTRTQAQAQARQERLRAEAEQLRAEQAQAQAEQERLARQAAEAQLAKALARLREMGMDI